MGDFGCTVTLVSNDKKRLIEEFLQIPGDFRVGDFIKGANGSKYRVFERKWYVGHGRSSLYIVANNVEK